MPILSNFPGGAGSGSGGVTLGAVSNINVLVASGKAYVKWTDPSDIVVSGSTLAAWGGTLLVRKAGSAPKSRRDGTVVLDSKREMLIKHLISATAVFPTVLPTTISSSLIPQIMPTQTAKIMHLQQRLPFRSLAFQAGM